MLAMWWEKKGAWKNVQCFCGRGEKMAENVSSPYVKIPKAENSSLRHESTFQIVSSKKPARKKVDLN